MANDFTVRDGGVTIKVEGLRDTIRSLEKSGTTVEDLKELMTTLSMIVIQAAAPPVTSGRLAGTIRPSKTKNKATIRAGSAGVPYAGPIHYGWPGRNISPQPFLDTAIEQSMPELLQAFDDELDRIFTNQQLL